MKLATDNVYVNEAKITLLNVELTQQKKLNQLLKVLIKKERKKVKDTLIISDNLLAINLNVASKKAIQTFNKIRFAYC